MNFSDSFLRIDSLEAEGRYVLVGIYILKNSDIINDQTDRLESTSTKY